MTSRYTWSRSCSYVAAFVALSLFLLPVTMVTPVAVAGASPDSGAWAIEPSPNPVSSVSSEFAAVSCSGPDSCVAVGVTVPATHAQLALIERLSDGSWTIASNPAIAGATDSPLAGVSCPKADFCVAVGYARYPAPHTPFTALAETWNGSTWKLDSLPMPSGATDPSLTSVSCAVPGSCIAVGDYIDAKTDQYRPLSVRLADHTWSVLSAPDPRGASGNSAFTGIDCTTSTSCDAVGDVAYNDTLQSAVAYGLSGSTWTNQTPVNPGPDPGNTEGAVSCSAANSCTSVGSVDVVESDALVEYWNGTKWDRQATIAPKGRPENALFDVSCDSGLSCLAVGVSSRTSTSTKQVMAEVWNGNSWTQAPPLAVRGVTIGLAAVSCTAPTMCIAVGSSATTSSVSTLVEMYTG
jgi:hypothetical protein